MQDRATWHDFSPGPLQQTGNPLDVAIDGDAFLVVQTPRGERYTRNGALQINATGELVTSDGDQVLGDGGPIQFQTTDRDIVDQRGRHDHGARGRQHQGSDSARGKLRLVRFDASAQLQKDGPSTVPRARRRDAAAAPNRRASCRARSSNRTCARVVEMARMIEVTRTYTQIASLLQQQGDMRRNAIEQARRSSGLSEIQRETSPCERSTPRRPE